MVLLSKSKYLLGLQCPRLLWTSVNGKLPEVSESVQHRFDQGHLIGEFAKQLFVGGVNVPTEPFMENIEKTKKLILERKTLFEAGIMIDNLFARADMLVPVGSDEWDIVEVKSSTTVKDVNIHDVSFQKYVYSLYGLKIRKCYLMCINNQYVRDGKIESEKLFVKHDITGEVEGMVGVKERIDSMIKMLNSSCPPIDINPHCNDPYECAMKEECWKSIPPGSVFELRGGNKQRFMLYNSKQMLLKDIPEHYRLNLKQMIQRKCAISGEPHIDKNGISKFLKKIEKPLYYLDFETFSTALPVCNQVRPYQAVPFQFSLHIVDSSGMKHHSFLATGLEDPRITFMSTLKSLIGSSGSIIAYNKRFEENVLKSCAEAFPEYKEFVKSILPRFVDLLEPFRDFNYYHPKQEGSASIKKVLPCLTNHNYLNLDISEGESASFAFLKILSRQVSEEETLKIREDLEKYCELDTLGMVWIVEALEKIIK